ncbi:hypothetical protein IPA_06270 [Ignicoccus pacificus DSM 13166]|uniref:Uncharacterized protein n=1 Tax=Ignicoccus pacificus DSM 13166 TaxID=940294 RepID=A0A977KCU3_9CREN|nr:hypothetical protein IPA_06270 [Ignicoccus pacificus DSM 13166]
MRNLSPEDVPLLPSKEFLLEFLLDEEDSPRALINALKEEIEMAKKRLEKEQFPCKYENVASLITLSALQNALIAIEALKDYEEGKEVDLEKAALALETVLALIRASGTKALPESVTEILIKCCKEPQGGSMK